MVLAAGPICSGLAWVWRGEEGGAVGFALVGIRVLMANVCVAADHVPGSVLFSMHLTPFQRSEVQGGCFCHVHFVSEETGSEELSNRPRSHSYYTEIELGSLALSCLALCPSKALHWPVELPNVCFPPITNIKTMNRKLSWLWMRGFSAVTEVNRAERSHWLCCGLSLPLSGACAVRPIALGRPGGSRLVSGPCGGPSDRPEPARWEQQGLERKQDAGGVG